MKGIFYSLIAVLFITPLIMLTLTNMNFFESNYEGIAEKIVADKLTSYIKSIDRDMPAALDIMAKRATSSAVVYIEINGVPLNDSSEQIAELMINGTVFGNVTSTNFTLNSWTNAIMQKGVDYGFQTEINLINLTFTTKDNYHIYLTAIISVNASNQNYRIGIYRIYNTTISVPVSGFNDPLYSLYTNGILKREIRNPESSISGPAAFDNAVASAFYMPSSQGPTFLDRLEGRLNQTKYGSAGLESVVYIPEIAANGLEVKEEQSDIDYLYFRNSSYSGSPVNQSTYGWLRIDAAHAVTYNLTLI